MTDQQWETLLAVIRGETLRPLPSGFIIDSPWLPNWAGYTIMDYLSSERIWFETNMRAIDTFPETLFLPGFWSEYGMCTEPSAFGTASLWGEDEFPYARKLLRSVEDVDRLEKPDPRKNGLLPFVIKRLKHLQPEIERAGHRIRFAVVRGPLNIASFLMDMTEFLTAIKTDPDKMRQLLSIVTDFLVDWIDLQRECFPTIDGLLLLDDVIGFVSKDDFAAFGLPHLKRLFACDVSVKFLHNDAPCKACAPYLPEIGVNLLNFGVQHTLTEMRSWTNGGVTLLGNIPPRDVLAAGTPEDVRNAVIELLDSVADKSRLIPSCGGGMPPGVSTENIRAFASAVEQATGSRAGRTASVLR